MAFSFEICLNGLTELFQKRSTGLHISVEYALIADDDTAFRENISKLGKGVYALDSPWLDLSSSAFF